MRAIVQILGLFALWLIMSGIYKSLIIGFGAASSVLCVWIIYRLGLVEGKGILQQFRIVAGLRYLFWLIVEIGKADWAVAKVILAKVMPSQQRLVGVPANQRSDIAKVLFANSITITPGTVTVETESNQLIVHALTDEAADLAALEAMGARVCELERPERFRRRRDD
ncbi:MAG: Na+/H+ antiporter subunit E [Rhizobiaceae bacterium]